MKILHNIKSYSITWLSNTYDDEASNGVIENYYIPDTLEEFTTLCKEFYFKNEKFKIIGHTSNVYILPDTNIKNLISTRKLQRWNVEGGSLFCECGANIKRIARAMVAEGIKGFACLIDLPGTVGAAIYGNAGVSHDSVSGVLESVEILLQDGDICTWGYNDLGFAVRSSVLKRAEIEGVILSCRLRLEKGNKDEIINEAKFVHDWRVTNMPGASKNLGTTSLFADTSLTFTGFLVKSIVSLICFFQKHKKNEQLKLNVLLNLLQYKELKPYLFGLNRYIWNDSNAHKQFCKYLKLVKKMYKKPRLEIEVW